MGSGSSLRCRGCRGNACSLSHLSVSLTLHAAHGVNFLLHVGLLNLFLWFGVAEWLAPIPVYAIAIPVNFILVKYVFKKKRE